MIELSDFGIGWLNCKECNNFDKERRVCNLDKCINGLQIDYSKRKRR